MERACPLLWPCNMYGTVWLGAVPHGACARLGTLVRTRAQAGPVTPNWAPVCVTQSSPLAEARNLGGRKLLLRLLCSSSRCGDGSKVGLARSPPVGGGALVSPSPSGTPVPREDARPPPGIRPNEPMCSCSLSERAACDPVTPGASACLSAKRG